MKELIAIIFICVFAVVAFMISISPIYAFFYWLDLNQCANYQSITGKETIYKLGECYVKDSNEWFTWSEYKLRNATQGTK